MFFHVIIYSFMKHSIHKNVKQLRFLFRLRRTLNSPIYTARSDAREQAIEEDQSYVKI